jgi:hypothetical protein
LRVPSRVRILARAHPVASKQRDIGFFSDAALGDRPCLSLNHDNNPRGAWLNVLISRKFTFRHGICLRGGNVLPAGIMTLAWIEDDLDHEKCGKRLICAPGSMTMALCGRRRSSRNAR